MNKIVPIVALMAAAAGCSRNNAVEIEVHNPAEVASVQTVELAADDVLGRLGSTYAVVLTSAGDTVPSQLTHDGRLIFPASIDAGATAEYRVVGSGTAPSTDTVATGRAYPERADDLAWENELVGFRAYGPATQRNGERAYGYDIFFKHRSEQPVLGQMYAAQTGAANWARVDSLRATDPDAAREYERSFTYHVDHGAGMDCYAVGPTLGNGMAAFVRDGAIDFGWCYDSVEVLDRGPVRFVAHLVFAPRTIDGDTAVVEHRIITLDRGCWLNRQRTWFDGRRNSGTIAAGMPMRKGGTTARGNGFVAVTDSTQGPDNGMALLGVVMPGGACPDTLIADHALIIKPFEPSDTLVHYWGFAWNLEDFGTLEAWTAHLEAFAQTIEKPFIVKIK